MPDFIEETPVASPEQLTDERLPEREEPTLVDQVREEARIKEAEEKPLILGQYRTEDEAKAEFDRLKREHEEYNRKLEEFNQSERVRQARAQDLQEAQAREKAQIERSQRSRAVRQQAADLMAKGHVDEAADLMETYHAQNAALIAKAMLDEALKPVQEQLTRYQMREAEEQFINHPELQDIKHLSKQATRLLSKGWQPKEIVDFLREFNESSGSTRRPVSEYSDSANVVEMPPNVRDQTRRDARSLSPGGSTAGPRRSAFDQERLAEAAQRRKMFEETLGPLPERRSK